MTDKPRFAKLRKGFLSFATQTLERAHFFTCSELKNKITMKVYCEINLNDFKPWSGAKAAFYRFTTDELDIIEQYLEADPAVLTETDINDMFWFDVDWLLELLEINEEEFWEREPFQMFNL